MAEVAVSDKPVLLCKVDNSVYALDACCPHLGARLGQGALHGHTVVCPWHGWEFDCRTGLGEWDRIATYAVEVREGSIWIDA